MSKINQPSSHVLLCVYVISMESAHDTSNYITRKCFFKVRIQFVSNIYIYICIDMFGMINLPVPMSGILKRAKNMTASMLNQTVSHPASSDSAKVFVLGSVAIITSSQCRRHWHAFLAVDLLKRSQDRTRVLCEYPAGQ